MNIRKRLLSFIICGVMALSACPLTAFADDSVYTGGLCGHHREHNEECGYIEAAEESPCTHEHTEECYRLVTDCVHEHTEKCYLDGILPAEGEEKEADTCSHVCSEESGCVTKELDCNHEHNDDCGYVPAKEGSPCGYWCEICAGETEESDKADATDEIEETDEINKTEEIDETDETEETEESEKSFSPMSAMAITPTKPGGEGTEKAPYQIGTAEELYWFAGLVNGDTSIIGNETQQNTAAWAELTKDITLNQNVLNDDGNLNSGTPDQWTPIGQNFNERYEGTFDGQNHTISGLYIDSKAEYIGLFGYIGTVATVKNVGIVDSYINGSGSSLLVSVGAICGHNNGTVTNCYNTGTVSSTDAASRNYAGGVCGHNYGRIENCYNTGAVSGGGINNNSYAGGVCGFSYGIVENCYNTGTVSGESIGGVCGESAGKITECYNTGNIRGTRSGGVCGYNSGINSGTVENCYNTGTVSGEYAGGVCGISYVTVKNCYNTGAVSSTTTGGSNYAGGVCGYNMNNGKIENCYNTGAVSSTGTVSGSGLYAGGVCGNNYGTVKNCYNTGTVSSTGAASGTGTVSGNYVGGVCGENQDEIINCYNTGTVSGTTTGGSNYAGGVCGNNGGGTVKNCYYLEGTAETGVGSGSATLTDIEEKSQSQFSSGEVAWLLQNVQEDLVWGQKIGKDSYPKFSDEKVLKVTLMDGEDEIGAVYANAGGTIEEPDIDVGKGFYVDGWYTDSDLDGDEWDFENGIVQDITLYVKISKIQYNVTLKADGDGAVSGGGTYVHGTEVTVTADPDSGFRFVRWEENGTEVSDEAEYTFIIKGDRELTAVFERRSSGGSYSLSEGTDRDEPKDEPEKQPEYRPDEPSTPETPGFIDVDIFDWYHDGVMYATENGIMNGVGGNRFEPETELKREMLAVILWNMTDNPEPKGIAPFLDVTSDKYYAKAIAWANENGVMYGYGEEFGVGEAVTREDFAAILYRYAVFKGYDTTYGGMAIREFIDFEQIADYAVEALGWAVNSGIISGMGDGTVSPKTSTYRGQAAVMLMKFCENIMK